MTVTTTRPANAPLYYAAGTLQIWNGSGFVGAGDLTLEVRDNSDSTWWAGTNSGPAGIGFYFDLPVIPGGNRVKEMRLRARSLSFGQLAFYAMSIAGRSIPDVWFENVSATIWEMGRITIDYIPASIPCGLNWYTGGGGQIYELYLDTVHAAKPVATVSGPTGTIPTNRPTLTLTATLDSDAGPLTKSRFKVFTAAEAAAGGFDPETSTSSTEIDSGEIAYQPSYKDIDSLLADGNYVAYGKVAQSLNGTFWSDWDAQAFTVDAPQPAAPRVTASGEDAAGRIRIAVDQGTGGQVFPTAYQVQKSENGDDWEDLRTVEGGGMLPCGMPSLYDYIMALDPELYWPLNAEFGVIDQSGNGHDGAVQAGLVVGGAGTQTADPDDSSTNFDPGDGSIRQRVKSTYDPFASGERRTFLGIADPDIASSRVLWAGDAAGDRPLFSYPSAPPAEIQLLTGGVVPLGINWPNITSDVFWALVTDTATNVAEGFVNGVFGPVVADADMNWPAAHGNFQLGGSGTGGSNPFDGQMSHVAIFERGLTAEEIARAQDIIVTAPSGLPSDVVAWDFEARNGGLTHYRARAVYTDPVTGDITYSTWVEASAAWESNDYWLKHPTDPANNIRIAHLQSYPGKTSAARQGVFQPLGAKLPIISSDTRGGPTGTLKIRIDDETSSRDALDILLATTAPLLLQLPPGDGDASEVNRWIGIGEQQRNRYVDNRLFKRTLDELPWIETNRPSGDLAAWPPDDGGIIDPTEDLVIV